MDFWPYLLLVGVLCMLGWAIYTPFKREQARDGDNHDTQVPELDDEPEQRAAEAQLGTRDGPGPRRPK